jgi:hypothetical protein
MLYRTLGAKSSLEFGRARSPNPLEAHIFPKTSSQKQNLRIPAFAIYSPFFWSSAGALSTWDRKLFSFRDHFLAFSVDRPKGVS